MLFEKNCMNCGHTLDLSNWGPSHTCPCCGKCTVNVNIKEVHVSFSDYHNHCLSHFISNECFKDALNRADGRYEYGMDYERLLLGYKLCYGNISDPPYSNANYYAHHFGSAESAKDANDKQLDTLKDLGDEVPIYLWLNNNDANELMNLLYFSKEFTRFDSVYLVRWIHTEKDFDGARISMLDALNNKKRLSKSDIDDLYARFTEIQGWNAECLVGNSYNVEPWEFSKIEEYVLGCMSGKYRHFSSIYLNAFDAVKKDTSFYLEYHMVVEAVYHLMMIGKIDSHGACQWWGDPQYNNLINTQKFRIAESTRQDYSEKEMLYMFCEALEFGYTYPLYEILSDEAILTNGEQTIKGKWDIIKNIENDGADRVHCKKENVNAHVVKVEDGENYQKGDIYILFCYEEEEGKYHNYLLVKLFFDESKVNRIEISKPRAGLKLAAVDE